MNRFISIPAMTLLAAFAIAAPQRAAASSGALEARVKTSLNTVIQNVKETRDPVAKREMLGNFLARMDQGIETAKKGVSEKDGQALGALQLKLRSDYSELTGTGNARIPDAQLNGFANYVQQDMEQADGGVYISVGALIIILILLLIFLH